VRVLRRAALALLACALLGACGKSGGGGDGGAGDGGAGDTAPTDQVPTFNVFTQSIGVWPGSLVDVKIFFQAPPSGTWHVTLGQVTGDAQVTLAGDTLNATTYETYAHVDTAATATGMITFPVTASDGARQVQGLAEIGLYSSRPETMPGYQITAGAAPPPDASKARFKVRVVGFGGFQDRVHLAAAATDGNPELTFGATSLMISGATPAETWVDVQRRAAGPAQLSLWGVWRTHVETANASEGLGPTAAPPSSAEVSRKVVVTASDMQQLRFGLWPADGSGLEPTIELAGAAPGFTLSSAGLFKADAAAPGVVELPVLVRRQSASASAKLHVSVVPAPRAGWTVVGGAIAGRDCGGAALSALAAETVTFGTAARCRFTNGQWARLGDDGSAVFTFTRGTKRFEARQSKTGVINLNVVDTDPNGNGTRFWEVVDERGDLINAPTAAVDDSGQWWLAFRDANGRPRVFRRGTVGAGVPASDGLPFSTGTPPAIGSNGAQLYLAITAADGAVRVYSCARTAAVPTWALVEGLDGKAGDATRVALDVDAQQRPVVAWTGADGQVHAARYAGAWDALGAWTPHAGGIALKVAVVADRAGEPVIGWQTAAHVPMKDDAQPAATSGTAIELRRGAMTAKLEPTDARNPITAFALALDETGTPVVAAVEGPVTQVLRWTGP
jgi:hypothetical protein